MSTIRKRIMIGDSAKANLVSDYRAPAQRVSECMAEAFLGRVCVAIDYQSEGGERTRRVIEAQYILLNWPIWYFIAWDHLRGSSRVFRIDRIKTARLVDGTFQLRPKHVFTDMYAPFYDTI